MEWEFDAPRFWDLLETIPQQRPTDSWFCTKNVSNPSFETPKKRRTLRVFKYSNATAKKKLQEPIQKRESVFERLSRESTISFSRKMNQPLTPQQRQLEAQHTILNDLDNDDDDQELIVHSSKETVGERIARLEGTYLDQGKRFGLGKKTIKLKQNINHSSHRRQTIDDEIPDFYEEEERTSSPPPITPTRANMSNLPTFNSKERSPLSPHIPIQNASPIRKRNSNFNHAVHPVVDKVVSNFFEGLLKLASEREKKTQEMKEAKAIAFFENLLLQNAPRREAKWMSTSAHNDSNPAYSPRKRKVSTERPKYYTTEGLKRTRIDSNDA